MQNLISIILSLRGSWQVYTVGPHISPSLTASPYCVRFISLLFSLSFFLFSPPLSPHAFLSSISNSFILFLLLLFALLSSCLYFSLFPHVFLTPPSSLSVTFHRNVYSLAQRHDFSVSSNPSWKENENHSSLLPNYLDHILQGSVTTLKRLY